MTGAAWCKMLRSSDGAGWCSAGSWEERRECSAEVMWLPLPPIFSFCRRPSSTSTPLTLPHTRENGIFFFFFSYIHIYIYFSCLYTERDRDILLILLQSPPARLDNAQHKNDACHYQGNFNARHGLPLFFIVFISLLGYCNEMFLSLGKI